MTCRLSKARIPLQESFVYRCMYKSGSKTFAVSWVNIALKLRDAKSSREVPKHFKTDTFEILNI